MNAGVATVPCAVVISPRRPVGRNYAEGEFVCHHLSYAGRSARWRLLTRTKAMITLYTFGPAFGLPDPSPFVTKAEVLLKMAGVAYRTDSTGFRKAPKGKLPYIDDDGKQIADSTFIRAHLENKFQVDFDKRLSAEQRAIGWAFEKMAEDNLYWALVDARWFDESNFAKGPIRFFQKIPAPMRPLLIMFIRRQLKRTMYGHGMGRHTRAEIIALGTRSIGAIADFLGSKPFFMGSEPTGADATMFAFVAGTLCPQFETSLRTTAETHDNLRRYVGRMAALYYPDLNEIAGCKVMA
jgi:glutathione S-transferase